MRSCSTMSDMPWRARRTSQRLSDISSRLLCMCIAFVISAVLFSYHHILTDDLFPLTSAWLHLRCDVGLEEGDGDRSFASVGPKLWNSLPDDITSDSSSSLPVFSKKLKTHVYRQSYPDIILSFAMVFCCHRGP